MSLNLDSYCPPSPFHCAWWAEHCLALILILAALGGAVLLMGL